MFCMSGKFRRDLKKSKKSNLHASTSPSFASENLQKPAADWLTETEHAKTYQGPVQVKWC